MLSRTINYGDKYKSLEGNLKHTEYRRNYFKSSEFIYNTINHFVSAILV